MLKSNRMAAHFSGGLTSKDQTPHRLALDCIANYFSLYHMNLTQLPSHPASLLAQFRQTLLGLLGHLFRSTAKPPPAFIGVSGSSQSSGFTLAVPRWPATRQNSYADLNVDLALKILILLFSNPIHILLETGVKSQLREYRGDIGIGG